MFIKVGEIKNLCFNCSEHTGLGRAASSLERRREIQRLIDQLEGENSVPVPVGNFRVQVSEGIRYTNTERAKESGDSSLKFVRS